MAVRYESRKTLGRDVEDDEDAAVDNRRDMDAVAASAELLRRLKEFHPEKSR